MLLGRYMLAVHVFVVRNERRSSLYYMKCKNTFSHRRGIRKMYFHKSCIVHLPPHHLSNYSSCFLFHSVCSLGYGKNIFSFRVHIWVNRRHLSLYVIKKVQRALHIRVNGIWFELCACTCSFLRCCVFTVYFFYVLCYGVTRYGFCCFTLYYLNAYREI